jgi:RNA polymerase sporulation-specific sigma factor
MTKDIFLPHPLTREEELYYCQRMNEGDLQAKEILITHNLRLVKSIANRFSKDPNFYDLRDDFYSIGCIGLIKGIDTFDLKKGRTISTYCSRCVENEILMHIRNQVKKNKNNVSLSDVIHQDIDGNDLTYEDILINEKFNVEEQVITNEMIKVMLDRIGQLDNRLRTIVEKYRGINGHDELKQKEIGKIFGIQQTYVSRLHKRAIKLLEKDLTQEYAPVKAKILAKSDRKFL